MKVHYIFRSISLDKLILGEFKWNRFTSRQEMSKLVFSNLKNMLKIQITETWSPIYAMFHGQYILSKVFENTGEGILLFFFFFPNVSFVHLLSVCPWTLTSITPRTLFLQCLYINETQESRNFNKYWCRSVTSSRIYLGDWCVI